MSEETYSSVYLTPQMLGMKRFVGEELVAAWMRTCSYGAALAWVSRVEITTSILFVSRRLARASTSV